MYPDFIDEYTREVCGEPSGIELFRNDRGEYYFQGYDLVPYYTIAADADFEAAADEYAAKATEAMEALRVRMARR